MGIQLQLVQVLVHVLMITGLHVGSYIFHVYSFAGGLTFGILLVFSDMLQVETLIVT